MSFAYLLQPFCALRGQKPQWQIHDDVNGFAVDRASCRRAYYPDGAILLLAADRGTPKLAFCVLVVSHLPGDMLSMCVLIVLHEDMSSACVTVSSSNTMAVACR